MQDWTSWGTYWKNIQSKLLQKVKQDDTGFYLAKFKRGNELNSLNLWLMPEFRSVALSVMSGHLYVSKQAWLLLQELVLAYLCCGMGVISRKIWSFFPLSFWKEVASLGEMLWHIKDCLTQDCNLSSGGWITKSTEYEEKRKKFKWKMKHILLAVITGTTNQGQW